MTSNELDNMLGLEKYRAISSFCIFDSVDSTNSYLMRNHRDHDSCTVVLALEQTHGRGRYSRKWTSQRGGLWFTLLLKPRRPIDDILDLYYLIPISIVNTLNRFSITSGIKWPNDILVSGRKAAGILVETIIRERIVEVMCIGCGINVENDIPAPLEQTAINLRSVDHQISYGMFTSEFFKALDQVIFLNKHQLINLPELARGYFTGIGERYEVWAHEKLVCSGIINEINARGEIVMTDDHGRIVTVSYGEIFSP